MGLVLELDSQRVHRAHFASDHWNRRSRWISSNTLSVSEPGPVLHLLLHHVQLLGERGAGTLLSPEDDGYNFLSRAREKQKVYRWFRAQLVQIEAETNRRKVCCWCRMLERAKKWNLHRNNSISTLLKSQRLFCC